MMTAILSARTERKTNDEDANNKNLRVLVIDDNRAIHEDFRKILQAKAEEEGFDQARAALFGDPPLSRGARTVRTGLCRSGASGVHHGAAGAE